MFFQIFLVVVLPVFAIDRDNNKGLYNLFEKMIFLKYFFMNRIAFGWQKFLKKVNKMIFYDQNFLEIFLSGFFATVD